MCLSGCLTGDGGEGFIGTFPVVVSVHSVGTAADGSNCSCFILFYGFLDFF